MEKILESLIYSAPVISKMFDGNVAIAVSDKEKYIYILEGENIKLPMKIREKVDNETFKKAGISHSIYIQKKTVTNIFNKEEHGIDSRATIIPAINEKDEVVGFISFSTNIEKFIKIKTLPKN